MHAIAVQRILDHARTRGRSTRSVAEAFLDRRWPDLVRWHRWLAECRDPNERGRVTALPRLGIRHGQLAAVGQRLRQRDSR